MTKRGLLANRHPPPRCMEGDMGSPEANVDDNSFYAGFGAGIGLVAAPVVFISLYNVASTGSGLDAGPYGLLGALEGVSFLVVMGVVAAGTFNKMRKGTGLPAGPFGLLGAVEGFSFLALLLAVIVFPLRELGIVGDPASAVVDVPATVSAAVALVSPLLAALSSAVSEVVKGAGIDFDLSSGPAMSVDGTLTLPKLPQLPSISPNEVSLPSLPQGLSLPSLPQGLALPSLPEGISLPQLPTEMPSLQSFSEGLPSLQPPLDGPAGNIAPEVPGGPLIGLPAED